MDRHRTLEIDERLDVAAMRAAAERMLGERDFGALGADARGWTVRHLAEVRITARGPLVVTKLFDEIGPKYADRSSGFTRIVKIGQRAGDAAPMVQIELV